MGTYVVINCQSASRIINRSLRWNMKGGIRSAEASQHGRRPRGGNSPAGRVLHDPRRSASLGEGGPTWDKCLTVPGTRLTPESVASESVTQVDKGRATQKKGVGGLGPHPTSVLHCCISGYNHPTRQLPFWVPPSQPPTPFSKYMRLFVSTLWLFRHKPNLA